jgi:transposase InsO family protein
MSPGRSRFFVIFKDDFSNWCEVQFMQTKSQVPDLFRNFVASLKTQHNATVRVLRSDNGGEYIGREFQEWLSKMGIRQETSAPYTPQQVYKQFFLPYQQENSYFLLCRTVSLNELIEL